MSIKAIAEMTETRVQSIMALAMGAIVNPPNAVAATLGTAFQATDPTRGALCVVNLTSTAQLTLGGGQTHTGNIVIGSTAAVAAGTGTVVGVYTNSQTGTVIVGVGLNAQLSMPIAFYLPKGWYYAVRQTAGTITIVSAYDQAIG